jgi:hypothetical protein
MSRRRPLGERLEQNINAIEQKKLIGRREENYNDSRKRTNKKLY